MPETKVRGYWVRADAIGRDGIRLTIGRKVPFLGLVGEGGDLSRAGAQEAILILQGGNGAINLGGKTLLVSPNGTNRVLLLQGRGRVELSVDETAAVIAVVQQAIREMETKCD